MHLAVLARAFSMPTRRTTSNTRYRFHGEATVVYHEHFIRFIAHVCNAKDKPSETNTKQNFSNALKDVPTLTELCYIKSPFLGPLCLMLEPTSVEGILRLILTSVSTYFLSATSDIILI